MTKFIYSVNRCIALSVAMVCALLLCMCGKDGGEEGEQTYGLYIDCQTFHFSAYEDSAKTWYKYDGEIYIKNPTNWCKVTHDESFIYISVDANQALSPRSTPVYVKTNAYEQGITLYISQDGVQSSGGGTGGNQGGGTGGGSQGGGNQGGGTGGGGTTPKPSKPSAPTGVYARNEGSVLLPDIVVRWSASNNATSYSVYRSSSANGYYSLRGNTSNLCYYDSGCKIGNVYYYKVKASNSAGESDFSQYAEFDFKDTRKPGPVTYGNCSVNSSGSMTLRWSVPTDSSYGKPTKAILKVRNPNTSSYVVVQELSGTATSATFSYGMWIDSNGFVYAGILLENENGTGGGNAKVYDAKNKKWIN